MQAQALNHPLLLHLRDVVVSEMGKGRTCSAQVWIDETNESEPLVMCRKRIDDVKIMVESSCGISAGGNLFTACAASGVKAAGSRARPSQGT
ncbi:hypothetical protein ACO3RA_004903 [Escherichia coli]|uniref:hypothetical protein n=1 Tax=Escherichia coli TaxID=562 RepID=UPI00295DD3DE|nr:hypothetical protein [Escherichia coli]